MKGKGLIVVAVIAVLVAAWPAWLGWQADRQLAGYHGGRMGDVILVHDLESFDRGWLESRAVSGVQVSLGPELYEFRMRHRIRHGFGRVQVESEPLYGPEAEQLLAGIFGGAAPLRIISYPDAFGRSAEIHVRSPSFDTTLPDEPEVRVRSAGLDGGFQLDDDGLRGSVRLPEFALEEPEGSLSVSGQVLELDLADPGSRVADGAMEYRADRLEVTGIGVEAPLRLERLRIRSVQERQGEYLDLRLEAGFGALQAGDWEAGQGETRLQLGPVHAATFDALLREMEQLDAAAADGSRGELMAAIFMEYLPRLLEHSPELTIEPMRVEMPQGNVDLALGAGFNGDDFRPGAPDILQRIQVTGRLQAGRALAEELAGVISLRAMAGEEGTDVDAETRRLLAPPLGRGALESLVREGYVRLDDDGYSLDLELREGRLSVSDADLTQWLYILLMGAGMAPGGFN